MRWISLSFCGKWRSRAFLKSNRSSTGTFRIPSCRLQLKPWWKDCFWISGDIPVNNRKHFRPQTARAVASRADSLQQFGLNLRDWFHEIRRLTTRNSLERALSHRPPRLRNRFHEGEIADAFLAAQVEFLCRHSGVRPPRWTRSPEYVLEYPWFGFSPSSAGLRAILIRDSPPEFKNRNLFTTSEIVWKPMRGRPRKSQGELRETNRLRQQRWRETRRASVSAARLTSNPLPA